MNINFKIVEYGSLDWKNAVKLREDILRQPLEQKFTSKELDEEKNHLHIVGFLDEKLIATAVLVPENLNMKAQRVVVNDDLRNSNIGSKMMTFCETYSIEKEFHTIYCHARDSAVNFYPKNGYTDEGDDFVEEGIPHLKMKILLLVE